MVKEEKELEIPKPVEEETWNVKQVPTEYGLAVVNEKTEEVLDIYAALAKILTKLEKLEGLL